MSIFQFDERHKKEQQQLPYSRELEYNQQQYYR